jgi:putative aminopeptidase FrvX
VKLLSFNYYFQLSLKSDKAEGGKGSPPMGIEIQRLFIPIFFVFLAKSHTMPLLEPDSINLLKELSEAFGPSGFEREPASIVRRNGERYAEVLHDKLGSVILKRRGESESPKILLAGHMDEVGFVVTGVDKDSGFITFSQLGGWFDQVLLGHRVIVMTRKGPVFGVIAAKPPHLMTEEQREKVVKKEDMFIDVGASSKETVEEELGVRIGDPVAPWSPFTLIRGGRIAMGKAFDDRIGTFVGLEVLRRLASSKTKHPNTLYFSATVQEEVGLRGAQTVANLVEPDLAFALEVDIAGDVPGIKQSEAPAKMGKGPSILAFDASMIPNQEFKRFVIETAESAKIPYQLSVVTRGGTDAGRFHLNRAGCPSIVIGVPTRHIHSHDAIADLEDIDNAVRLVSLLVQRLDEKTIKSFTV